jgi:tetratricopeptide (TPR) repeat protein
MTRLGELARRRDAPAWTEVYQWFDEALRGNDFTTQRDLFLARMGRAGAADQLKQYPAALDDYRWVADRQPGNYWASVHSGRLVWLLEKDFAAAEAYLSSAISIDDTSKWAYRELAHVYMQSGLLEGAIELYQQVLTLDPNDSLAKEKLHALISSDGP